MSARLRALGAIVGIISTLIVIVGGVIGIWKWFSPDAPRIVASISSREFRLPPDLVDQFQKLRASQSSAVGEQFAEKFKIDDNIILSQISGAVASYVTQNLPASNTSALGAYSGFKEYVQKTPDAKKALEESFRRLVTEFLVDYSRQAWAEDYRTVQPSYSAFTTILIENTGTRRATGVELNEPNKGTALIERPGKPATSMATTGKIPIGDLLPQETATVSLWTLYNTPSHFDEERFHVSYAEGVGSIWFSPTTGEIFGTLYFRHPFVITALIFALIIIGTVSVGWIVEYAVRRARD